MSKNGKKKWQQKAMITKRFRCGFGAIAGILLCGAIVLLFLGYYIHSLLPGIVGILIIRYLKKQDKNSQMSFV